VFEGRVELIGCKFKDGLPQLYNIIFYGTTKKILDSWGETLMNEVDWSAYDHTASYSNILSSWDGTLLSGDILWTIADYNQGWRYSKMTGVNGNIRDARGVEIDDLRPSIRLRAMLTTVFESINYTLSGSFLTRPEMDDLYMLPMQTAGPLYDPEYVLPGTFEASVNPFTYTKKTFATTNYIKIIFPATISNPSGNYNSTTGVYTANRAGNYTFRVGVEVNFISVLNTMINFAWMVNGRVVQVNAFQNNTVGASPVFLNVALKTGDQVTFGYSTFSDVISVVRLPHKVSKAIQLTWVIQCHKNPLRTL
jgi:hypothetical protein